MNVTFQIEGLDKLAGNSKALQDVMKLEIGRGLFAGAERIAEEARNSITDGNKTGRTYTRGGVSHISSAPGESPASDTGRLLGSIGHLKINNDESIVKAGGTGGKGEVKYATMLEFGTKNMLARPFMFPAFKRSQSFIIERMQKAVDTAIRSFKK